MPFLISFARTGPRLVTFTSRVLAISPVRCAPIAATFGWSNNIDPQRYLEYALQRTAEHPINRIKELLPWNVADKLGQPDQVTSSAAAAQALSNI